MSDNERWRGFTHLVSTFPAEPDVFRVVIIPSQSMGETGPGGVPQRVPTPATVHVRGVEPFEVVRYHAPEVALPGYERADYEARAVEIVREQVGGPPSP